MAINNGDFVAVHSDFGPMFDSDLSGLIGKVRNFVHDDLGYEWNNIDVAIRHDHKDREPGITYILASRVPYVASVMAGVVFHSSVFAWKIYEIRGI